MSNTPGNETLELYYSKPLSIFALVCAIGIFTTSGAALFGLAFVAGLQPVGWFGLAIVLPILFVLVKYSIRGLFHSAPVVVLDADGVTDTRKRSSFVPWSDISHISLGSGDEWQYLRFQFRTAAITQQHAPGNSVARVLVSRLTGFRDWNINLISLGCSRMDVLRTAKRLHQLSVANEVREINRDGGRDLFVVDRRN